MPAPGGSGLAAAVHAALAHQYLVDMGAVALGGADEIRAAPVFSSRAAMSARVVARAEHGVRAGVVALIGAVPIAAAGARVHTRAARIGAAAVWQRSGAAVGRRGAGTVVPGTPGPVRSQRRAKGASR